MAVNPAPVIGIHSLPCIGALTSGVWLPQDVSVFPALLVNTEAAFSQSVGSPVTVLTVLTYVLVSVSSCGHYGLVPV